MEADLSQQTGDQHRPQQGASGNPGLRPAIAWLRKYFSKPRHWAA